MDATDCLECILALLLLSLPLSLPLSLSCSPFLFPFECRQLLFYLTTFDRDRAIARLQVCHGTVTLLHMPVVEFAIIVSPKLIWGVNIRHFCFFLVVGEELKPLLLWK